MTPKEKAEELIYSVSQFVSIDSLIKPCALDRVDDIIELVDLHCIDPTNYWQQVKQEIENL